ncbi:MAG: flavodoxin family protein [Thermodesulfobacteriota bacterium]
MQILAFNGSPRKNGNTSAILKAMLKGAKAEGAKTKEIRLHDIDLKGCLGCLSCRKNPGKCKQQDDLSPYLEAIKTCDGVIFGTPIYMYHVTGQMKIFIDRCYSLYISKPDGSGYDSAVPAGKRFALVTSQGHPDVERFQKPIRWLTGMTGTGLGMIEVGRIIQGNSHLAPARLDEDLLQKAFNIGRRLVKGK